MIATHENTHECARIYAHKCVVGINEISEPDASAATFTAMTNAHMTLWVETL